MIDALFLQFLEACGPGVVALVAGRYIGRGSVKLPVRKWRILLIFLQVWIVVFAGQLAFGGLGHALQLSEAAQVGFADFLLPLVVGAYFARKIILLEMDRGNHPSG